MVRLICRVLIKKGQPREVSIAPIVQSEIITADTSGLKKSTEGFGQAVVEPEGVELFFQLRC